MNNLFSLLNRAALAVVGALALGACNRSEYAMLPRSASYLGTAPVASTPRPVAPVVVARPAAAPVATSAPVAAVVAPAPAAAAPAVAAAAPAPVAPTASVPAEAPAASPAAPAKLNLVQRLALQKISKRLNKLTAQTPQLKRHDAAAGTARLDGNLRTGILFLLVGLIISLLGGISGVFTVVGLILAVIGLIFLVLWLLDQA